MKVKIIIQKFGGTSVASHQGRQHVANKIKAALAAGFTPVVTVSAMGRKGAPYATDTLLELAGGSVAVSYTHLRNCGCMWQIRVLGQGDLLSR